MASYAGQPGDRAVDVLTPAQKKQLVERLRAGRERAKRERPQRLRAVETDLDELGREFRSLPDGHPRRLEIIREVRPLTAERARLKWGRTESEED